RKGTDRHRNERGGGSLSRLLNGGRESSYRRSVRERRHPVFFPARRRFAAAVPSYPRRRWERLRRLCPLAGRRLPRSWPACVQPPFSAACDGMRTAFSSAGTCLSTSIALAESASS